ncbi:hypothetical protein V5O48_007233 [Marasmius crinis-equi]|uniref:Cytochrome P450 n=1 Tax=Marasmius crinis-equi TaxID=585013 RepID=A0ABR3FHC0_9AGAR
MFVGLPLCRKREFIDFTRQYVQGISKACGFIRFFPSPIRMFVGRPFYNFDEALLQMMEFLRPLYNERRESIAKFGGNEAGNPEDKLTWFMGVADGETNEEKLEHIAYHMLMLVFGAVNTISTSFAQAIHHLAAHPEILEPLREEVADVVAREGWSKNALGEMRKLDGGSSKNHNA